VTARTFRRPSVVRSVGDSGGNWDMALTLAGISGIEKWPIVVYF
jgi:hypothetical protein